MMYFAEERSACIHASVVVVLGGKDLLMVRSLGSHDNQTLGADLSLVTVGLSFTVAKGFVPLRK